jgi:hypothetical protein
LHVLELGTRIDLDVREIAADRALDLPPGLGALSRPRLRVDERVLLDAAEVLLLGRDRHDPERHRVPTRELLAGVDAGYRHLDRAGLRIDDREPVTGPDAVVLGFVARQKHAAGREPLRAAGADVEVEDAGKNRRVDRHHELLALTDSDATEPQARRRLDGRERREPGAHLG